eukprot:235584_1
MQQLQEQIDILQNAVKKDRAYMNQQVFPVIRKNQKTLNNINKKMNIDEKCNQNQIETIKDRIFRNEVLVDRINVEKNKKETNKNVDFSGNENGIDWRSGSKFAFDSIKDQMLMILQLVNPNLKFSQLYIELNNIYLIENIEIQFTDNTIHLFYRTLKNPQNKLIGYGLAKALKNKTSWFSVRDLWLKNILKSISEVLICFIWKRNEKFWKRISFDSFSNQPPSTLKTPVWLVVKVHSHFGFRVRDRNDPFQLISCGKNGAWRNPRNYYNNGRIPRPIKIDNQIRKNIIRCDIGWMKHYYEDRGKVTRITGLDNGNNNNYNDNDNNTIYSNGNSLLDDVSCTL